MMLGDVMKTGPSKLYRKLALNRRSNRITHTVYGGTPANEVEPIKDYWKARTITASDRRDMVVFASALDYLTRHIRVTRGLKEISERHRVPNTNNACRKVLGEPLLPKPWWKAQTIDKQPARHIDTAVAIVKQQSQFAVGPHWEIWHPDFDNL